MGTHNQGIGGGESLGSRVVPQLPDLLVPQTAKVVLALLNDPKKVTKCCLCDQNTFQMERTCLQTLRVLTLSLFLLSYHRNNFIHIDIFYKELSFERIKQNKAFEFLSLISEIGGFLGLLLGASVLTMCEIIDYVTMAICSRLRRNRVTMHERDAG